MANPLPTRKNEACTAHEDLVRRGMSLLREDPKRPIGRLGSELHVSQRTLNRAFQRHAKMTVQEAQKRMRLDAAAAALLDGKRMLDAAWRAGYSHPRHLADPFRRYFGISPAEMQHVGRAMKYIRRQARQPAPFRGSYLARRRGPNWRADRRTLRRAFAVMPDCPARRRIQRSLELRLKRLVEPDRPLTVYEVYGLYGDLFRGLYWGLGDDERTRAA